MNERPLPLVSVIISFLNEEVFLAESVESVIAQSYTNWELILVDDGSTDHSEMTAKQYAASDPDKIFYTDHEGHANRGLSYSRNQGIAASKGDLIAFLDADDVWLPDKLKIQVALLLANPKAAMLCEASAYWYYPWDKKSDRREIIQVGKERDRLFAPFELIKQLYPLSDGDAPCPSGTIIWRDPLLKHGGFEPQFTGIYQLYEDQAFFHKIYLNEYVYVSSFCNNMYRQHESSLVRKITEDGDYDKVRRYFLEWLEQYMKRNNIEQKEVLNLLKKALEPYRMPKKYVFKKIACRIYNKLKRTLVMPVKNQNHTGQGHKEQL